MDGSGVSITSREGGRNMQHTVQGDSEGNLCSDRGQRGLGEGRHGFIPADKDWFGLSYCSGMLQCHHHHQLSRKYRQTNYQLIASDSSLFQSSMRRPLIYLAGAIIDSMNA